MKQIFTALTVLAFAGAVSAEGLPYFSLIADDAAWQVLNVEEGSNTWTAGNYGDGSGLDSERAMQYRYDSEHAADDWLVSPAISLESGKEYKVKLRIKSHKKEIVKLLMAREGSPEVLKAGKLLLDKTDSDGTMADWTTLMYVVTPEATGDWYFGIWENSAKNQWNTAVTGFEVKENVFMPGGVTSLAAVADPSKALKVDLSWVLPTVDADGAALPEGYVVDGVTVYRDGADVPVAELKGAVTEWTDSETMGLTGGFHSYKVVVSVNGVESSAVTVDSGYVGPLAASSLPWNAGVKNMTADDFALFYTVAKGDDSLATKSWEFKANSYSGNYMQFYPSSKQCDDWLISPPLKAGEAGIYRLRVNAKYSDYPKSNTMFYIGTGTDISGYGDGQHIATLNVGGTQADHYMYFRAAEGEEFNLAIREKSEKPGYNTLYIYDMEIDKWHESPLAVSGLTATLDGETVKLGWTNPTESNIGEALSSSLSKLEVYRGEETEPFMVITDADKLMPGAAVEVTDTPGVTGVLRYSVVPWLGANSAEGERPVVWSPWIGDQTQQLPYECNFKDASLHSLWKWSDVNGDGTEWEVTEAGAKLQVPASDAGAANDMLLTPPFDLKAGYYVLQPRVGLPVKGFEMKAGVVSDEAAATVPELLYANTFTLSGSSYTSGYEVRVRVEEAGKYRFAFLAEGTGSDAEQTLKIENVKIEYLPVTPGLATNVRIVPAADLSLKATVSWTNPASSNVAGVPAVIERAELYRRGELIATVTEGLVPGEVSEYVDENVPEAGEWNYRVEIYGAEGCTDGARAVTSPWIGGGLDIPDTGYVPASFSAWKTHNVNNDTDWDDDDITWEPEYGEASVSISSNASDTDDWIISPRLNLVKGSVYDIVLKSWNEAGQRTPVEWDLHVGTSTAWQDMTCKVATVTTDGSEDEATEKTYRIKAVDPEGVALASDTDAEESGSALQTINVPAGIATVGFHANAKGKFRVAAFKIVKNTASGVGSLEGEDLLTGIPADATSIVVCDASGKIVKMVSSASDFRPGDLDRGIYMVSFISNGTRHTLKLAR